MPTSCTLRRLATVVVALALASGTAACSGDDDGATGAVGGGSTTSSALAPDSTDPSAAPTSLVQDLEAPAELREAATTYARAFLAGDVEGTYALLDAGCRARYPATEAWAEQLLGARAVQSSLGGTVWEDLTLVGVVVARVDATSAAVITEVDSPDGVLVDRSTGEAKPWVLEQDGWRTSDCLLLT